MYDTEVERNYDTQAEKAVELDIQTRLDRILQKSHGIWELADLAAPTYLYIKSEENGGEEGVSTAIPIPDGYLPKELSEFLAKHHDHATLRHLADLMHAHTRSRLAQLGLDGELIDFIWRESGLAVKVQLFSRSCRSIQIKSGQRIITLFTTFGSQPKNIAHLTDVCWYTEHGQQVAAFSAGQRGHDYGLYSVEELATFMPDVNLHRSPETILGLMKLSPVWKIMSPKRDAIQLPSGEHSTQFRQVIDQQLEDFISGEARLIIGQTTTKLHFSGHTLLLPNIVGIHKETGKILELNQTNSPCMGNTSWSIRVEATTVNGQPISATELAEYDFYMLLQFFEDPAKSFN